jgi:CheY-like chemotaxis protein
MDGMEATKTIRNLPGGKEVKVVAVTASVFMEQRDEMLAVGMDDFVRKPYRAGELYECLTRQLGVQYIYAEEQANAGIESPVALTTEILSVLSPELRSELQDALISLDSERISAIVQQIATHDAALYKTLSRLVDNFDYQAILKALQTN